MEPWRGEAAYLKHVQDKMHHTEEALARELAALRTGRASGALVEGLRVEAYGGLTPLNQMAGITVPEARMIVIQPWDRSLLPAVEKAILKSDLGLTPSNDGQVIRLPIPPLTEERRKELAKVARHKAEECRVSVRLARREANEHLKAWEKDDVITEDEHRHVSHKVQELTDKSIAHLDETLARKEKEILEG